MRGIGSRSFCALVALAAPAHAQGKTPVVIELVLALDSSASVDAREFDLQNEGIALAFRDPEVLQAVDNLKPFGAAIAVVQWGGAGETQVVLPFTHIENVRDAKAFGFRVSLVRRWMRASSTSIAAGITDAHALIESNAYDGQRKVIDVSGDGPDNSGNDLEGARKAALASGITINGLSIEAEEAGLHTYYLDHVIIGADSFAEPAQGFEDFARAIREKLLRELRPLGS
ncbi:MAG: DUF1194 domain-containing protein [Aestuariivirga sp.]|nr:DUF1194 domain-containing protein [Aestuariivirga sp.]